MAPLTGWRHLRRIEALIGQHMDERGPPIVAYRRQRAFDRGLGLIIGVDGFAVAAVGARQRGQIRIDELSAADAAREMIFLVGADGRF